MTYRFRAIFVSLLLVVTAGAAAAKEIDKHFHESFDVGPGAKLILSHGDGNVRITPWDKDVIDVDVVYRATVTQYGLNARSEFSVDFRQEGDEVEVTGRESGGVTIGMHRSTEHEYLYTVRAPRYVDLRLVGDDGDVDVEGWRGSLHFRLSDGDLSLRDVETAGLDVAMDDGDLRIERFTGDLAVKLSDGDLRIEECRSADARVRMEDGDARLEGCEGTFRFQLEDGDLEARRHTAGTLEVRAEDGDVEIELVAGVAPMVDVETEDGNVTLTVAAGIAASLTLKSDDGAMEIDVPEFQQVRKDERHLSGTIGGGGDGTIRLQAEDGDITIRQN